MKNQTGMTLVEILLVLVIAGMILYLSLQQYTGWRMQANATAVREQVGAIFQAMAAYYRANCSREQGGALSSAKMDVTENHIVPIDVERTLREGGYLQETFPLNPLIQRGQGNQGFIAQFNLVKVSSRTICTAQTLYPSGLVDSTSCTPTANSPSIGTVVTWAGQVAVHLNARTPAQALSISKLLGADCLSSDAGGFVLPCGAGAQGSGYYAVWQRAPSAGNQDASSPLWTSMPLVNQFKQMYTTQPVTSLVGNSKNQYFECGD